MKRLHNIPIEIIPVEIYEDQIYIWAIGNRCTSTQWNHFHSQTSDDHHGCLPGNEYVYCECSQCYAREDRHYYETLDYDYVCENCLNDNHPRLPEGLVWHV